MAELTHEDLPEIPAALLATEKTFGTTASESAQGDWKSSAISLNLDDPFEKVIAELVELQRKKAQDYAADGDTLKNMKFVVEMLDIEGYTVIEDCNAMVLRKCARIVNLRGRDASNESIRDSYLDRAVYAVLALVALDGD